MRTMSVACLALAVMGGWAGTVRGEEIARDLITKAIKAYGEEEIGPHLTFCARSKGAFFTPGAGPKGQDISFTRIRRGQPGAQHIEMTIEAPGQKITLRRVFRGGKGWQDDNGAVSDLDTDEFPLVKHADYLMLVLDLRPLLKDKSFTLETLGKSEVEGIAVLGVKVSSSGQPDLKLYFDPTTGLLKQWEYRLKTEEKAVLTKIVRDDYRVVNPVAEDERTLKAAGVATEGAALVKYLRGRVRSDADRDRVEALVRQLGDDSFDVREKATTDLIELGEVALPELRLALKGTDAEVVRRAQHCLEKINVNKVNKELLAAAFHVLAFKRPAGAVEVLLDLAPSVTDEDGIRELRGALLALALSDGKPDKLLEKALEDKDPARRSAAMAALGKDGGSFAKQPNRRVFPRAVKWAMKETHYEDGEKQGVEEVLDVQFYNRFDDKIFDKPK